MFSIIFCILISMLVGIVIGMNWAERTSKEKALEEEVAFLKQKLEEQLIKSKTINLNREAV